MSAVLALQAEVAAAIAEQVHVRLTPREANQMAAARAVDPEAHQAYLMGRHLINRYEGPKSAVYFQQAIDKDPNFAPAYAGLAGARLLAAEGADDTRPAAGAQKAKKPYGEPWRSITHWLSPII